MKMQCRLVRWKKLGDWGLFSGWHRQTQCSTAVSHEVYFVDTSVTGSLPLLSVLFWAIFTICCF